MEGYRLESRPIYIIRKIRLISVNLPASNATGGPLTYPISDALSFPLSTAYRMDTELMVLSLSL